MYFDTFCKITKKKRLVEKKKFVFLIVSCWKKSWYLYRNSGIMLARVLKHFKEYPALTSALWLIILTDFIFFLIVGLFYTVLNSLLCMCTPCVSAQCEDAAVGSVRSQIVEPPGPESLRRREESVYADSRCVYLQAHYEFQGCWQHT